METQTCVAVTQAHLGTRAAGLLAVMHMCLLWALKSAGLSSGAWMNESKSQAISSWTQGPPRTGFALVAFEHCFLFRLLEAPCQAELRYQSPLAHCYHPC